MKPLLSSIGVVEPVDYMSLHRGEQRSPTAIEGTV